MLGGSRGLSRLSTVLELVERTQKPQICLRRIRQFHTTGYIAEGSRSLPKSLRSPKPSSSASSPPRSAPDAPLKPPSAPTPIPSSSSGSSPAPSTSVPTPHRVSANTPSWPWRPVPSTAPGVIEEERLIYARPFEGPLGSRVRMLWFLVPFYGIVVGFYLTTPSLPRKKPPGAEDEAGDAADPPPEPKETPGSVLWSYTTPAAIIAITLTGAVALLSPSRFVTRLSLVRQRSSGSGDKASEKLFVRMQHGGHLMMSGELAKPRQLPLEEVQVRQIAQRSPYLSLKVLTPRRTRFSLDAWPYRLDFRDTAVLKHTDEEVVLSLQRIEQVFGRL